MRMKLMCGLVVLVGACLQLASSQDAVRYTPNFDNLDLDEILGNERLYKKYLDCLTGEGKCTPEGKELKENLPDALKTNCSKCTEKQKAGAEKALKYIIEKRPDDWAELEKIYDPDGTYKAQYQEEAEKRGIKIESSTLAPQ